jgi:outer membrane protein TolC
MRAHVSVFLIAASLCLAACSGEWHRKSADDEVYPIVEHDTRAVLGEAREFRIEQEPVAVESAGTAGEREDLRRTPAPQPVIRPVEAAAPSPGSPPSAPATPGAPAPAPPAPPAPSAPAAPAAPAGVAPGAGETIGLPASTPRVASRLLGLADALRLAFANNREYQTQKEQVYLSALRLTLARHQFAPRLLGIITGDWDHAADGSETGTIAPSFNWSMLFINGARLSITVAQTFFQFFTGERREVAETLVSGTLAQPLLRGFGTEIVREPLTQAERDVVYQVRTYERFRRTFAVSVISQYYRVLQGRDRVTNAYLNWQSLVTNRDRVENLASAGLLPQFEVDQARQQELEAQDNWNATLEQFESALDLFKITLGISVSAEVSLQQAELQELASKPVESLGVPVEAVIQLALESRLDLQTARERLEDAGRRIGVAADALRAQLDVTAAAALTSGDGGQTPLKFEGTDLAYGVGFSLDLPLDRKAERNAYVATVIGFEQEKRDYSLLLDNVRLTVRDAFRRLEREIVSYEIQQVSSKLAADRVSSTSDLLQAGRAETRDVLDSQSALNNARNAVTDALINYAIARLELLRDTESLRVSDEGQVTAIRGGRTNDRA